ncbi:MAG: DNA repair protein RecN [Verrucomicrobiae bacterium]|nr:DNA repair protein RecN [Verrucomicrobiae bacterium]
MLLSLRIKNLAIVEDATLEFSPGFNAITGETGAGKSIIIGALSFLLGERADRGMIRSGVDSCVVEAEFDIKKISKEINQLLETYGVEKNNDSILILKRVLSGTGSTRQFVNGSAVTVSVLKSLGDLLVDIHGPHDHQSLLSSSCQIELLDSSGNLNEIRVKYAELVEEYRKINQEIQSLVIDEQTFMRQLDMLQYQVNEITAARLKEGEDEELEQEYNRARNSAVLAQLCASLQEALVESEDSVVNRLSVVGRMVNEMQKYDPSVSELINEQHVLIEQTQEFASKVSRYADRIEVDEARLASIEQRLDLINSLKRKYGPRLSDVIAFGKESEEKLNKLRGRSEELERLSSEQEKVKGQLLNVGRELSRMRRKCAPELEKSVVANLNELGFRQSVFKVSFEYKEADFKDVPSVYGFDKVEFMFSPNPGEVLRPLRQIASSGELARVMLAIKAVLAEHDRIPVLVFDEVDANIGGETAVVVGEKMRQIGRQRQVLCITHLASVAAAAAAHYLVRKDVVNGRTFALVESLDGEARVSELARMLGGRFETAVQHAKALLKKRN